MHLKIYFFYLELNLKYYKNWQIQKSLFDFYFFKLITKIILRAQIQFSKNSFKEFLDCLKFSIKESHLSILNYLKILLLFNIFFLTLRIFII
jgi:hypothetical protein